MKNNTERQQKIRQLIRENNKRQILPDLLKDWQQITGLYLSKNDFLSLEESDNLMGQFSFPYPSVQIENNRQALKTDPYAFTSVLKGDNNCIDRVFEKLLNKLSHQRLYLKLYNYDVGFIRLKEPEVLKKWEELLLLDGDELWIYQPGTAHSLVVERAEDYSNYSIDNSEIGMYEISVTSEDWK